MADPNNFEKTVNLDNMPSNSKSVKYSEAEDFEKEVKERRAKPQNVVVSEPAVDLTPRPKTNVPDRTAVTTGKAYTKKKNFGTKFKEAFVGDEHDSVSDMVAVELADGAKDLLWDLLSNAISIVLFGSSRGGGFGRRRSGGYYDYSSQYSYGRPVRQRRDDRRPVRNSNSSRDIDGVVVDTKEDADFVISQLNDYIYDERYGVARVADLYSLCRMRISPTDEDWGWYNLRSARARRVNDGWLIDLPAPEYIRE